MTRASAAGIAAENPEAAPTGKLLSFVAPFARGHRRWLAAGGVAAVLTVLVRLALPWPLARILGSWTAGTPEAVPDGFLLHAGAFVALFFVLGATDFFSRYAFGHFAVDTVGDLRLDCLRTIGPQAGTKGNVLTRLVSDTARVKDALKGLLVHVATNGLLFLGVAVALYAIQPSAAHVMLVAAALVLLVTYVAARLIDRRALRIRRREGVLAEDIRRLTQGSKKENRDFGPLPFSRKAPRATLTAMQGRTALVVYCLLGLAIPVTQFAAGDAAPPMSEQARLVFIAYSLMLIDPTIRLSNQGTRMGKIAPCIRLIQETVLEQAREQGERELPELGRSLRLVHAESSEPALREVVRPLTLTFRRGEKVAVLGAGGSGKTTLLSIAAGESDPSGRVAWDDNELSAFSIEARARRILRLTSDDSDSVDAQSSAVHRLAERAWDLALLDGSLDGRLPAESEREVREVLAAAGDAIVLATMSRPTALAAFDRVLVLERGRLIYDGPPAKYRERRRVAQDPLMLTAARVQRALEKGKLPRELRHGAETPKRVTLVSTAFRPDKCARFVVAVELAEATRVHELEVLPDARAALARFQSLKERNQDKTGSEVREIPGWLAVATAGTALPYLRSLGTFLGREEFSSALGGLGLAGDDDSTPKLPRLVACEPRRWALLRWRRAGSRGAAALIAVHAPEWDKPAHRNLQHLTQLQEEGQCAYVVPRLLVHDRTRHAIFATEPERFRVSRMSELAHKDLRAVGAAMADLHQATPDWLETLDDGLARRDARTIGTAIEFAFPHLSPRLTRLRGILLADAPPRNTTALLLGAVGENELVASKGRVWFMRWDSLNAGDPMQDLGLLLARVLDPDRARSRATLDSGVSELLAGYRERGGTVDERGLAWYQALGHLRRAERHLLGTLAPRWKRRIEASVAAAEMCLPEN